MHFAGSVAVPRSSLGPASADNKVVGTGETDRVSSRRGLILDISARLIVLVVVQCRALGEVGGTGELEIGSIGLSVSRDESEVGGRCERPSNARECDKKVREGLHDDNVAQMMVQVGGRLSERSIESLYNISGPRFSAHCEIAK
jgi:hypothetical protein